MKSFIEFLNEGVIDYSKVANINITRVSKGSVACQMVFLDKNKKQLGDVVYGDKNELIAQATKLQTKYNIPDMSHP